MTHLKFRWNKKTQKFYIQEYKNIRVNSKIKTIYIRSYKNSLQMDLKNYSKLEAKREELQAKIKRLREEIEVLAQQMKLKPIKDEKEVDYCLDYLDADRVDDTLRADIRDNLDYYLRLADKKLIKQLREREKLQRKKIELENKYELLNLKFRALLLF